MSGTVITFLWIVFSVGVWIIYHKIFSVYYFNLFNGLMKELVVSAFVGALLTVLVLSFWWVADIILILVGLGISGKTDNPSGKKAIIVVFAIVAVVVAILGISIKSNNGSSADASARGYSIEETIGKES